MLSTLQKALFQLHKIGYWYMCPLPVKWNVELTQIIVPKLTITRMLTSTIPFVVLIIFNFIMVLGNLYNVLSFSMNPDLHKEYNFGYAGIHIACGIAMFDTFGNSLLTYKNTDTIKGVNEFLQWETDLSRRFERSDKVEIFDILLIILNIVASGTPLILFAAVLLEYDPLFYFFEDFILSSRMYRSRLEVCLGLLSRFTVMLGALECARTLTFITFVVLVMVNRMTKVAQTLLLRLEINGCEERVRYYKEFIVAYRIYKPMFSDYISLMITSIFWAMVALFWVIIKGYDTVPLFLYLLTFALCFSFFCVSVVALDLLAKLDEHSLDAVLKCRKESKCEYVVVGRSHKAKRLALVKESKALHPIVILYSPFSRINNEFVMSMLQSVVNRLVDALVLFG